MEIFNSKNIVYGIGSVLDLFPLRQPERYIFYKPASSVTEALYQDCMKVNLDLQRAFLNERTKFKSAETIS
jgi:hypothetical protein